MPTVLESLRLFLPTACNEFNRDLVDRVLSADRPEIQVNVRTDRGNVVEDKSKVRSDGKFEFYSIRYPKSPGAEPDWQDRQLTYPFDEYYQSIGSTGFSVAGSLWVGFDIDTILGHAPGHGVAQEEINRIDQAVKAIPYVEVRRSTHGQGRHIYVRLTGFDTKNHTEHSALARAILGKVCFDTGLDFTPSIDGCGGNLWFLSRGATLENRGFELLQPATQKLTAADVPAWREHVAVVQRKRTTVRVEGLDEEFASSYPKCRKDAEHDRILSEYRRHGFSITWQPDYGCFQLHTAGLAKTHQSLELKGAFQTVSAGDDPGEPNAFAFLRPKGALFVVRFGTTTEHPLWSKTSQGQPCTNFNLPLDPKTVCRAVEATSIGNGFTCATVRQATEAALLFGFKLPEITERHVNFIFKPGEVIVETDRQGKETAVGWGIGGRKLKRAFPVDAPAEEDTYDDLYRHVVTADNADAGWRVRRDDGRWGTESKDNLKDMLAYDGLGAKASKNITGRCGKEPWIFVNEPFEAEFLSGRRWNRGRKLQYIPTQGGELSHPHFDMIFEHCGRPLDEAVVNDPWCVSQGVKKGADYLLLWAASLMQRPKHPLPYLFFFSRENNTGKSSFYRALGLLIEGGAVDVHAALMEQFNQQMAGAVLCYVEERTLNAAAYAKLKSWVDSPTISIREMRTNSYTLPNYAHFVQTANQLDACPIEPDDERVVVMRTEVLEREVAWTEKMEPALRREAPDFLATLFATPLPPARGRLFLPVLGTVWKDEIMGLGKNSGDRAKVIKALADRIVKLVSNVSDWYGFGGNLLDAVGPGPWSGSAGTLVSYLQDAVDELRQQGIVVSIAPTKVKGQRQICIGQEWLIEPKRSDAEFAEDEERVARLQDQWLAAT